MIRIEFTLVGFGFGGFITTFGGSFHAPAGLESWYDGKEGPAGGTLPKSAVEPGTGVVCPVNKNKRVVEKSNYLRKNKYLSTNHERTVDWT